MTTALATTSRNVSPDVASMLRGMLYNWRKKEIGKPAGTILGQNDPISTAATVAKETGGSASFQPGGTAGTARPPHGHRPAPMPRAGGAVLKSRASWLGFPNLPTYQAVGLARGFS